MLFEEWRQDPERRILLVRGARQVGKTFSVRMLGSSFNHYIEVNFEESREVRTFFAGDLDIDSICRNLSAFYKTPIVEGETLLFFDEIQACPDAIRALRFFHEKKPALHVVAAGSLLEFALRELPSYGVGRISSLYMYPLSFKEFLWALEEDCLWEAVANASSANPLNPVFHNRLIGYLRIHQLIGGMPAVVDRYSRTHDLLACKTILDDLLRTIRDDFAKYASRVPVVKLVDTFTSVAYQAGGKFMFARAAQDTSIASYKTALDLLVQAGLVYRIYHTSARGIPLGAQIDEKKFKACLMDTGLHQRLLGLDLGKHLLLDPQALVNAGNLAEVYAGVALVAGMPARTSATLYYWHREARASNAEIDYVISRGSEIVPIEVKSNTRGAMKSMHVFISEGHAKRGIRLSNENFAIYGPIDAVPLYAAELVPAMRRE
jgi:predicted AAA+ superfamily ATPase